MKQKIKTVQVQTKSAELNRDQFLTDYYRNGDADSKLQRRRLMDPMANNIMSISQ